MRRIIWAGLVLAGCVASASGQDAGWWREDFENGIEVAITNNDNGAVAAVRCVDDEINLFFQVQRSDLDPALKAGGGDTVDLTLRVDNSSDIYWARTTLFVSIDGFVAADYSGRDARLWAETIAQARSEVEMGFALNSSATIETQYNAETFSATGSTATANEILVECGK